MHAPAVTPLLLSEVTETLIPAGEVCDGQADWYAIELTTSAAVADYLPGTGTAGTLDMDYTDPNEGDGTSSGVYSAE